MKVKELRNWFELGDKNHQEHSHHFNHKNKGGAGNNIDDDEKYHLGIEWKPSTASTSPSSYVASPASSFEDDEYDNDEEDK